MSIEPPRRRFNFSGRIWVSGDAVTVQRPRLHRICRQIRYKSIPYAPPKTTLSKMLSSGTLSAVYFTRKRPTFSVKYREIKLPKTSCNLEEISERPITKRNYSCGGRNKISFHPRNREISRDRRGTNSRPFFLIGRTDEASRVRTDYLPTQSQNISRQIE